MHQASRDAERHGFDERGLLRASSVGIRHVKQPALIGVGFCCQGKFKGLVNGREQRRAV